MSEDAPELTAELVGDGAVPSQPAVSPDGRWVAYVVAPVGVFLLSDRAGSPQLHRVRAGGGQAEVLTDWRGEIAGAWPLA